MMDQPASQDQSQDSPAEEPPEPLPAAADAPPAAEEPAVAGGPAASRGAGRRILAALVLVPWILAYGSIGAWAVAFGARGVAAGQAIVDAGYTRMVTPGGVILVGGLLLAAFSTLMLAGLLLIYGSRNRVAWAAVAVVAAALTGGAVWAGVRGDLAVILWLLFFFGLVYALALAVFALWRASRAERVLRP